MKYEMDSHNNAHRGASRTGRCAVAVALVMSGPRRARTAGNRRDWARHSARVACAKLSSHRFDCDSAGARLVPSDIAPRWHSMAAEGWSGVVVGIHDCFPSIVGVAVRGSAWSSALLKDEERLD